MKMTLMSKMRQKLSIFLCMMLIAATACMTTGCNDKTAQETTTTVAAEQETVAGTEQISTEEQETAAGTDQETTAAEETTASVESTVLGEGKTRFILSVVEQDGTETQFEIHTDKQTVGEALLDCDLVEGDQGEYGLYIKKVNGIEADYDKDGTYWAFYINGEYATTGVDSTDITDGATYSLKVEK